MARLIYARPVQRKFLPLKGTTQLFPVGPRPVKKPRFNAFLMKARQKPQRIVLEADQGVQSEPEGVDVVKTLWVALSEHHVGHQINITNGGETAVCGQTVASAKPYHGDKFCKKCLQLSKGV